MSEREVEGTMGSSGAVERRFFLGRASSLAMAGGLAGGYGGLALMSARFLYPPKPPETAWLFVADVKSISRDRVLFYRTPRGEPVAITRHARGGDDADGFIALSSTCPHLGCKVHWEPQNQRFFCPCHGGAFGPEGTATAGPPADAGQDLLRFSLKVEKGLLYIEVPVGGVGVADGGRSGPHGEDGRVC